MSLARRRRAEPARESLDEGGLFLDLGLENAFRVASAVVDRLAG